MDYFPNGDIQSYLSKGNKFKESVWYNYLIWLYLTYEWMNESINQSIRILSDWHIKLYQP
jgi:hypothetical protein